MFVRWQTKPRAGPRHSWREREPEETDLLTATLAECRRVDGKPRQSVVAYLGSIREGGINFPVARLGFWQGVDARLDRHANRVAPDERAAIEAKLAARVPRPTAEELAEAERRALEFDAKWSAVAAEMRAMPGGFGRRRTAWANLDTAKLAEIEEHLPRIERRADKEWAIQAVAKHLGVTWNTVQRVWRRMKVREELAAAPDHSTATLAAIAGRYGLAVSSVRRHLADLESEARRADRVAAE